MGRVNKFTSGVFTDIVGDQKETPAYLQFLGIQDLLKKPSEELTKYMETYRFTVTHHKNILENLARLEDVIMQIRTRDNLTAEEIRFNVVRQYIYARIPLHRKDNETKDIRVIVGKVNDYHKHIKKYLAGKFTLSTFDKLEETVKQKLILDKKKITDLAKEKLVIAINEVINDSVEVLTKTTSVK